MAINLLTMAEVAARRTGPLLKGKSRLQQTVAADKLTVVDDAAFKREVRERDKWCCRKCTRLVKLIVSRRPERAEVHHIHGRRGDLRHETRAALLLCLSCHEQVTGRVNEKWVIVPTRTFRIASQPGREFCDARVKVTFERVA